jgi:MbtH protein
MEQQFHVVLNDEEQYSIWPVVKSPLPLGWRQAPFTGTKEDCLQYIESVWTDITPKSLRS